MSTRPMPKGLWRVGVVLALWLLWAVPLHARTVAIVPASSSSTDSAEIVTRLRGELLAVGLDVQILDRSGETRGRSPSRSTPPELRLDGEVDSVIQIAGDETTLAVDVWIIERSSRQPRVSRVEIKRRAKNAPETLAIRAVEVLRSALLENDMALREGRPESGPAVSSPGQVLAPSGDEATLGLAGGVATLVGLDGVGPAIMPMLRSDLVLQPWLVLQAAAAGLGSRPLVASTADSARLAQKYAVLGVRYRFRSTERLQPFLGASVGVLSTMVEGQAAPPRREHDEDQLSILFEGSTGADLQVVDRIYLSLAAHAHLAQPSVAVHIVDDVVATTGRPNLAFTLTLGGWL